MKTPLLLTALTLSLVFCKIESFATPVNVVSRRELTRIRTLKSLVDRIDDAFSPSRTPGLLSRVIRVANHVPAFLSLSYFGLVSMSSMMPDVMAVAKPTLASVLTQSVGPTTNQLFAEYFPTLVTPPSFVFLIWPIISAVQIVTLLYSALLVPMRKSPLLSQDDLSSLALANLAATWWLTVASQTPPGNLNVASCLILPLVPILSGFPLRTTTTERCPRAFNFKNCIFQLYSSFTVIASFLALTVELQHGGRLRPKLSAEAAASIFLGLYYLIVSMKNKSKVKQIVQASAITGIAIKRIQEAMLGGVSGVTHLFLSISFWGTILVGIQAIYQLVKRETKMDAV